MLGFGWVELGNHSDMADVSTNSSVSNSSIDDSSTLCDRQLLSNGPLVWIGSEPPPIKPNVDIDSSIPIVSAPVTNGSNSNLYDCVSSSTMYTTGLKEQLIQKNTNTSYQECKKLQSTSVGSSPSSQRVSSSNPSDVEVLMLHSLVKELYHRTCPNEYDKEFASYGYGQDPCSL